MTTMPGWDGLELTSTVPVALLPVRLETRRAGDTLRIRVFPDDVSMVSGGTALLPAEAQAGQQFWSAGTPEAWERLTRVVGAPRATHVARSTRPGTQPRIEEHVAGPRAMLLPDQWAVLGHSGPDLVLAETRPGPGRDVRTGPELGAPQPFDANDPLLVADPELRWLTDFGAAAALGLAFTVTLPAATTLDRLVVLGVHAAADPGTTAQAFEELLALHAARDRIAFVAPGTPTNTIAQERSGYSSRPPVYDAYDRVVQPPPMDNQGLSHSELARALGIGTGTLASLAGAADPRFPLAGEMTRAVGYATLGEAIGTMLRYSFSRQDQAEIDERQRVLDAAVAHALQFMGSHVRGAGPLPSLRVGRQPYGVLPATVVRPYPDAYAPKTLERRLYELRDSLERLVEFAPALRPGVTADVAGELRRILSRAPRPQLYDGRQVRGPGRTTMVGPFDEINPREPLAKAGLVLFYDAATGVVSTMPGPADAGTAERLRRLADDPSPPAEDPDRIYAVLRRGKDRYQDGGLEHAARALGEAALDPASYDALFADALSTVSFRLDAWFTGLAHQRLLAARSTAPTGLHVGAWGVVLDLPAADTATPGPAGAGYVHAPSLDQARTAGVLRAVEHELHGSGGTLASIDLTSQQARAARDILDAVASGQPLGAVLGARLERRLGDAGEHLVVSALRRAFPQRTNVAGRGEPRAGAEDVVPREVVDGFAVWADLVASKAAGAPTAILAAAGAPAAILDSLAADVEAVADVFVAEGVHQVVTGRDTAANATFAALAQGAAPPLDLDVLATPAGGTATLHRVLITLPEPGTGPRWGSGLGHKRERLAPRLEAWVASLLGPPEAIAGTDSAGRPRSIPELGLSYSALDAVHEAEAIAAALGGTASSPSLRVFVHLSAAIRSLLTRVRPAVPSDLEPPPASGRPPTAEESAETVAALSDLLDDVLAGEEAGLTNRGRIRAAVAFVEQALEAAGQSASSVFDYAAALAALPDGTRQLTTVMQLLGDEVVVPTFALTVPPDTAAAAPSEEVDRWLEQHGRVRDAIGDLDDLGLFLDAVGRDAGQHVTAAQYPAGGPWVGGPLPLDPGGNELRTHARPPGPRLHLVTVGAPFDADQAVHALVVDEFVETVPEPTAATGLAVHYDAPSACAPQSLLLAVHPADRPTWDWETLDAIVAETLELARLRMVDRVDRDEHPSTFDLAFKLPAAYLRPALPDDPYSVGMDLGPGLGGNG